MAVFAALEVSGALWMVEHALTDVCWPQEVTCGQQEAESSPALPSKAPNRV
jgi:hypothetical protein